MKLILIKQTHSSKVIRINKTNLNKNLEADGMITSLNNIVLGVLTADCAPILFYDPVRKVIACAHAGWRGALNGVIKNTVEQFNKLNCNKEDIIAAVGPCIEQKNYEVGLDFYEKMVFTLLDWTRSTGNRREAKRRPLQRRVQPW